MLITSTHSLSNSMVSYEKTSIVLLCAMSLGALNACGYYEAITGKKVEDAFEEPVSSWSIQPSKNDDAALRQELLDLALAEDYGDVQAFNVANEEWTVVRNPATSIITHRSITGSGVFKVKGEQMCRLRHSITYRQQYDGQNYGKSKLYTASKGEKVDCAKAVIPKDKNS